MIEIKRINRELKSLTGINDVIYYGDAKDAEEKIDAYLEFQEGRSGMIELLTTLYAPDLEEIWNDCSFYDKSSIASICGNLWTYCLSIAYDERQLSLRAMTICTKEMLSIENYFLKGIAREFIALMNNELRSEKAKMASGTDNTAVAQTLCNVPEGNNNVEEGDYGRE